jgi:hypothetical protein
LGYQVYRSDNSDVQPIAENLIEEIMDPFIYTFTDNQATVGVPYYYTVVANYDKGVSQPAPEVMVGASDIESNLTGLPQHYQLYTPYPNPFNPHTNIHFDLPLAGNVNLTVYGILGKKIATLVNERRPAGRYRVTFKADHLASGIYFVSLESGKFRAV